MFDYNSCVLGASVCGHIHLQAEYLLVCIMQSYFSGQLSA